MRYDCSRVVVPQGEDELAEYDWENFPPSKLSHGKTSFTVIDEFTGINGKLVTRNAFIHGQIEGLVFAEHVTIEKTASVNGFIFCRTLSISGKVNAHIVCDNVFVRGGGALAGVMKYQSIKIEVGASVAGKFERRIVLNQSTAPAIRRDILTPNFKTAMRE